MDIGTILVSAVVGILTSLITAYVTTSLNIRRERLKWEQELTEKIAQLKADSPEKAKLLTEQFAKAFLIVEASPDSSLERQKVFLPTHGRMTIGRQNCDLVILDRRISRTAASIDISDEGVFVVDFESKFGVYVNGNRIEQSQQLAEGDVIRIGKTHMRFHNIINR